jgi:hypothetical protein
VKVTGVALEMSPGLPSLTSATAAQSIIGPAAPLGEFTLTCVGFEGNSVTTAFSFETASVEVPILLEISGFVLVKTALSG